MVRKAVHAQHKALVPYSSTVLEYDTSTRTVHISRCHALL